MKTPEERLDSLHKLALGLHAAMPTDVMLKGDGSLWVTSHGNDGARPRKLSEQEALKLIFTAKQFGERMISV